ncbi:MAG TPA: hypothetical protein VEU96_01825 [Bryobacteraceae bacterium]|nr:hypothetical protein [Bryobacteraceae bacterium]
MQPTMSEIPGLRYTAPTSPADTAERAKRYAINRLNAQHSTGPRTTEGKARSSRNSLTHGLTSRTTVVLPSEDPAEYQQHCQLLRDEFKPKTPTENLLVQELCDVAWRLKRIPYLEAELLTRAMNPPTEEARIAFDLVDAHRALASLGMQGQRLSRQFQKTLQQLRQIQYDHFQEERRALNKAADLLELHNHKGLPWDPAEDGFVFTRDQVERHRERQMRHLEAHGWANQRFFMNRNALENVY